MLPILTALALLALPGDDPKAEGPFAQRGYHVTFMRMPTYDLADWKRIVDGIHDDGGNTVLLRVGGAFRSEKYRITWRYSVREKELQRVADWAVDRWRGENRLTLEPGR